MKDYLLKPIDWEELSDKLRMLICQAREDAVSAIQERVGDYLNGQKWHPGILLYLLKSWI